MGTACLAEEHGWCQTPECMCSCHGIPASHFLITAIAAVGSWLIIIGLVWAVASIL